MSERTRLLPASGFVVRSASLADARTISSVFIHSFRNDDMCRFVRALVYRAARRGSAKSRMPPRVKIYDWPPLESAERAAAEAWSVNLRVHSMRRLVCDPAWSFHLVEDADTGHTVGESGWILPAGSPYRREIPLYESIASWLFWTYDFLSSRLLPAFLYKRLYPAEAAMYDRRGRWMEKLNQRGTAFVKPEHRQRGTWVLAILGILPEYERRGLGGQLLRWGLEKADEEDRAVYLSASPSGAGLYRKHGFEVVHTSISFEGEPKGSFVGVEMCRPPKSERERKAEQHTSGKDACRERASL